MGTADRYSGTVGYTAGLAGQALTSGALVATVPATPNLRWTLEGWVKAPSTPGTDVAYFGWGTDGSWVGVTSDGNGRTNSGPTGYPVPRDGAWHHVAVVTQGDGRVEHWLDGRFTNEFVGTSADANTTVFYLGGRQATGHEWAGGVDEVRYSHGQRYTPYQNFTVPTYPLTVDATTRGLWHLDGGGADSYTAGDTGTGTGGGTGGSGGGTVTPPTSDTSTYASTTDVIANPDRGFFQYTDTHYNDTSGSGWKPLDAASLAAGRTGTTTINGVTFTARTLVFRYYYMDAFRDGSDVTADFLTRLAADLTAVRDAGCKVIPRFCYREGQNSDADPSPANVLKHVGQIVPTVNQYKEVVAALECGFVGAWGEWYYTNNFGDSGNVTAQNVADRNAVIRKLLDTLDGSIQVLVRYVGSRQTFLGTTNPNPGTVDAARLGLHNDAFLSPYADYGTYTTFTTLTEQQNRDYLAAVINAVVGGESAGGGGDGSWANAEANLTAYHWSFLNPNYHPDVLGQWGQTNMDTASRRLGYRLRLTTASTPAAVATPGQTLNVSATLTNDGYASPTRDRPVYLTLDDGAGHTARGTLTGSLRAVGPGQTVTFTGTVTVPSTVGTYRSYLSLPDPSTSLGGRPEYAVRLANQGLWDGGTGRHDLGRTVTVANAGTGGGGTDPGTGGGTGGGTSPSVGAVRTVTKVNVGATVRVVKLVR